MKKKEILIRLASMFGVVSCVSCIIISVNLMSYGKILLIESNPILITIEVIIGVTGAILNLYVLSGRNKEIYSQ